MKRILIVDDDPLIVEILHDALKDLNYQLSIARNGSDGYTLFQKGKFDLVILDVVMPRLSGFEVCSKIRKTNSLIKILLLTSKSSTKDKVNGFFLGANDYLTKPFAIDELIARINNLIKDEKTIKIDEMTVNIQSRTLYFENKIVSFCQKEFDLLTYMMRKNGSTISRDEILDTLWSKNKYPFPNTIDVHVRRLRKKLHSNFSQEIIHTVHGIGYKFEIPK